MDADLIIRMLSHEVDPVCCSDEVDEKHDEEKLHQRILISVQEAKTVDEGDLAADKEVRLLSIELLLSRCKDPAVRFRSVLLIIITKDFVN